MKFTPLLKKSSSLLLASSLSLLSVTDLFGRALTTAKPNEQVAIADYAEAVEIARLRGLGTMSLISPRPGTPLIAGAHDTFAFRFETGKVSVETGGVIRLSMRHVFHWTQPQTTSPNGAGYVTVKGLDHATLEVVAWPANPNAHDLFLEMFPWQHAIEIRVKAGALRPGDSFVLTYGDRSQGGPGARIQPTADAAYPFRTFVRTETKGNYLPLPEDVTVSIVGGAVTKLRAVARPAAESGTALLTLSAEDAYGNADPDYRGTMQILGDDEKAIASVTFTAGDAGIKTIRIATDPVRRSLRFRVSDGKLQARTNPLQDLTSAPSRRIYFGEIHGHSYSSDGHGTPEHYYRYCRDTAALDFCALTDHDFMMTDAIWETNTQVTDRFNDTDRFVTLRAYEWSGMEGVGGDHNVYFRGTTSPIYRSRSYYDYRNQQAYHGDKPQVNFIEDLYLSLMQQLKPEDVTVIPHWGGRHANPAWHNSRIERNIEIFSDHQRSHEWAYGFLRRGYRLGIVAGGDNHTGRPGYGFLSNPLDSAAPIEIGTGLVAVMADSLSRDAVFDALSNRRTYATSGDRILMAVTLGGVAMGGELSSDAPPTLAYEVEGTDDIETIEILRDTQVVHSVKGSGTHAQASWTDMAPPAQGESAGYWVRVLQKNGEEAISSPIWWKHTD